MSAVDVEDLVKRRRIQTWLRAVKWCPGCEAWVPVARFHPGVRVCRPCVASVAPSPAGVGAR